MTDHTDLTNEHTEEPEQPQAIEIPAGPNQKLAMTIATIPAKIKMYIMITETGDPIMGPMGQSLADLNLGIDMCKDHVMATLNANRVAAEQAARAANQDDTQKH